MEHPSTPSWQIKSVLVSSTCWALLAYMTLRFFGFYASELDQLATEIVLPVLLTLSLLTVVAFINLNRDRLDRKIREREKEKTAA